MARKHFQKKMSQDNSVENGEQNQNYQNRRKLHKLQSQTGRSPYDTNQATIILKMQNRNHHHRVASQVETREKD